MKLIPYSPVARSSSAMACSCETWSPKVMVPSASSETTRSECGSRRVRMPSCSTCAGQTLRGVGGGNLNGSDSGAGRCPERRLARSVWAVGTVGLMQAEAEEQRKRNEAPGDSGANARALDASHLSTLAGLRSSGPQPLATGDSPTTPVWLEVVVERVETATAESSGRDTAADTAQ